MTDAKVMAALKRLDELKAAKAPFIPMYELVSEFVLQEKYDVPYPTPLVNSEVYDSTAPDSCSKMAGVLAGMLWQNGAKSMILEAVKSLSESVENKEYFEAMNEEVRKAFDDVRAGFATALEEYLLGQCSFGTSGPAVFEGFNTDLNFEAWGVKEIYIADGYGGFVDTIYRVYKWPINRLIAEYGEDVLSSKCKEHIKNKQLDKEVTLLHCIQPRQNLRQDMMGNLNMPFESLHIEIDHKHLIKESGYEEVPAAIVRFYKESGPYGRSPSMKLMPSILEINANIESGITSMEKAQEPPIGVYNDSLFGNQKIKLSARAVNVLKRAQGRTGNSPPIFPMIEGGDPYAGTPRAEKLEQVIQTGYGLDRLLDFNNETQMTLGEAHLRDRIRGESFGAFFMRQFTGITMIVERSVSILFRKGKLGVIRNSVQHHMAMDRGENPLIVPDEIARLILSGKNFYETKYLSPAARLMETAEANGVLRAWEFAAAQSQANPEIMDNLDADDSLRVIAKAAGAPSSILVAKEMREKIRQQRGQMLEEQNELAQAQQVADAAATASQVKPGA